MPALSVRQHRIMGRLQARILSTQCRFAISRTARSDRLLHALHRQHRCIQFKLEPRLRPAAPSRQVHHSPFYDGHFDLYVQEDLPFTNLSLPYSRHRRCLPCDVSRNSHLFRCSCCLIPSSLLDTETIPAQRGAFSSRFWAHSSQPSKASKPTASLSAASSSTLSTYSCA